MYALDPELVNWAYELTKDMKLIDDPGQPNIERFIPSTRWRKSHPSFKGRSVGALRWHGAILNDWANQWVDYWTDGKVNSFRQVWKILGPICRYLGSRGLAR